MSVANDVSNGFTTLQKLKTILQTSAGQTFVFNIVLPNSLFSLTDCLRDVYGYVDRLLRDQRPQKLFLILSFFSPQICFSHYIKKPSQCHFLSGGSKHFSLHANPQKIRLFVLLFAPLRSFFSTMFNRSI